MTEQSYLYKNANHVGNLNNMRLSEKLCDVTIKVNEKEIRAHKVILAANLKYFESMFVSSFQESTKDVVTMQDIDETCLESFVSFAYTGEILLTDDNVLGLLEVANYLTEDGIQDSCIEFLKVHLKKEDACQTYKLAKSIKCFSLQKVAKQTILHNFEDCSLTTEFLNLDVDCLKDILSNFSSDFDDTQQIFFEGVMSWIFHDVDNRKAYISELLDFTRIIKINAQYLLDYFCENIKDQCDVVKDIMAIYTKKKPESNHIVNLCQSLMAIGNINCSKPSVQFYNFNEKKWSAASELINHLSDRSGRGTIWNNTFYNIYADNDKKMFLQIFHPTTQNNTTLIPEPRLLSLSAMCVKSKHLYFCGGTNQDSSRSNQLLRFDLVTNSFKTLAPMESRRSTAITILYQGYLHVLGGQDDNSILNSVEKYDFDSNEWTTFPPMCKSRYRHGVVVLDGKLYACGGVGEKSVEMYDPSKKSWQLIASMNQARYNFLVIAHGGKLLAIGGNNKTAEVYDPIKDQWQIDKELSSGLQILYPTGGLV